MYKERIGSSSTCSLDERASFISALFFSFDETPLWQKQNKKAVVVVVVVVRLVWSLDAHEAPFDACVCVCIYIHALMIRKESSCA